MGEGRCTVWRWVEIGPGTMADYEELKGFHYRGGRPGGVMRVFAARYRGPGLGGEQAKRGMVAGVAVESLPALACTLRSMALPGRFDCGDRRLSAAKLNREMRTISRVVVHPMFRSTGLAVELVKHVLANARTPYVEALAAMGRVHPLPTPDTSGFKVCEIPYSQLLARREAAGRDARAQAGGSAARSATSAGTANGGWHWLQRQALRAGGVEATGDAGCVMMRVGMGNRTQTYLDGPQEASAVVFLFSPANMLNRSPDPSARGFADFENQITKGCRL